MENLEEKSMLEMENLEESMFMSLYNTNVNEHKKEKNGLSFLSWTFAWKEIKKRYPDATYEVKRFGENNLPYVFDPNTGYMAFTTVTINGLTHEMWLPVMDNRNYAMKDVPYSFERKKKVDGAWKKETVYVNAATMMDINKTIMRCLVKNLAMFGLGLYIYANEDLPEEDKEKLEEQKKAEQEKIEEQKKAEQEKIKEQKKAEQEKIKIKIENSKEKLERGINAYIDLFGVLREEAINEIDIAFGIDLNSFIDKEEYTLKYFKILNNIVLYLAEKIRCEKEKQEIE